jgi:predicted ribosomally synthesized peptide with SipW-like signal peptide
MTNDEKYTLSRRTVLGGLGAAGVASVGAGLGTSAFFSDQEELSAALEAGRMDLLLDYRSEYYPWEEILNDTYPRAPDERFDTNGDGQVTDDDEFGPVYVVGQSPDLRYGGGSDDAGQVLGGEDWAAATRQVDACALAPGDNPFPQTITRQDGSTFEATVGGGDLPASGSDAGEYFLDFDDDRIYVDGLPQVMFSLDDVKPKDAGETTISLHLCTNDAYLWAQPFVTENDDNGIVEPEDEADGTPLDGLDGTDAGDLADFLHVTLWYDENCNNDLDAGEEGEANVMIVLDRSGSMTDEPNKFQTAKDGAKTLIDALGPGANVGLVSYADSASLDQPLGADRTDVENDIDGLSSGGLTNITDAVQTAQGELAGVTNPIMVVLTNGTPTTGSPQDPRGAATAAKSAGTEIYGIAYGSGANENVIEDISSPPKVDDGMIDSQDEFAFLAADIDDVENVFSTIAQQIGGEIVIWEGSLAGLVADVTNFGLNAVPLDGAPERNFALQQADDVDPFRAGVQCLAFEWYVPCTLDELRALGSSYSLTDAGGAPTDQIAGTMFDELVDRGVLAADGNDFDINVLQTDTLEFGARFAAVQSRHNMTNPSPFEPPENGTTGGAQT